MTRDELRNKIVQFAKTYEYSNLITIDEAGYPKGRMMENLPVGNDLVFWFATGATSKKMSEIKKNGKASIFLYRPGDHSSISVVGTAEIEMSNTIRTEKWKEKWTAYWKQGPTDPAYALIKIVPRKIVLLDFPTHSQEVLEF